MFHSHYYFSYYQLLHRGAEIQNTFIITETSTIDNTDAEFGKSTDVISNYRPKTQTDVGIDS